MLEAVELKASKRDSQGKGVARSLRRDGLVPAVLYGQSMEPLNLSIKPDEVLHALSSEYGRNTLLKISVEENGEYFAIVKDAQFGVLSRKPLHFDFHAVSEGKPIVIDVPFSVHGKSIGEQSGANVNLLRRKAKVECAPESIPVGLAVDVTPLDVNDQIRIADFEMPEGVKAKYKDNYVIVAVQTARGMTIEEEEAAEAEAAEAAAAEEATAEADAAKAKEE